MDAKRCRKCEELKPVEMFAGNGRNKDRLHHTCIACVAAAYQAKKERTRLLREENIDHHRVYARAYMKENPEKNREAVRRWREANADKARMQRRMSYALNPQSQLIRNHMRRARIKGNSGSFTAAELQVVRIAQNYQCAYCKRAVKLTIDHIIPVRRGGSNYISNICLACRRCNTQEHTKTPEEWTKRWYLQPPHNLNTP